MHEMSLVRDVIEVVVDTAEKNAIDHIATINMTIGYGRDVVPELFDGVFRHLSAGTRAEGANLVITNTPYLVRCRECGAVYHLDPMTRSTWGCTGCGACNYDVVSGMEFRIDSIEAAA